MSTILDQIAAAKRQDVAHRQARVPVTELHAQARDQQPPRGFVQALARRAAAGPAVIAEVKRGSPSLGCLRPELVAADQAAAYAAGGAAALSVLTDEAHFFARPEDFASVRARVALPMLRKDFLVDEYQVVESRAMGADCVLLILAILDDATAARLGHLAHELGMDVLAEAHTAEEVRRTLLHVPFDLLGINNRNLRTFTTRTETTLELATEVGDRDLLVAESGLHTPEALGRYWRSGIKRFLVGEAFVRSPDPAATVAAFVHAAANP
jgi:indole-3-glycerol phosphate synthase